MAGIPTQAEYERNEAQMFQSDLTRIERAPLADRKAGASECHALMREAPQVFARNSNLLFGGEYGYGARQRAWQILDARGNRRAMLLQLLSALDCGSPMDGTNQAYNALTAGEKTALNKVLDAALVDGAAIRKRKIADGERMANPAERYKFTVPPTHEMGSHSGVCSSSGSETYQQNALWDYNRSREREGLDKLSRMPAGTRYIPIR